MGVADPDLVRTNLTLSVSRQSLENPQLNTILALVGTFVCPLSGQMADGGAGLQGIAFMEYNRAVINMDVMAISFFICSGFYVD